MYLVSLISKLCTSDSTHQQSLAPSDRGAHPVILGLKAHGDGQDTDAYFRTRRKEQAQAMEEEEEARPPYPNVSYACEARVSEVSVEQLA